MSVLRSGLTTISRSVGRDGINHPDDVLVVQRLLNAADAGIKEDGDCGRATVGAIEDYQRNWTSRPDGRIDPGGTTLAHLAKGEMKVRRDGYVVLPQLSGNGYYSYVAIDRQYGTTATVNTLVAVCRKFAEKFPEVRVGIGDLSFANGAHMPPHNTHRNGCNIDIRPIRADGRMLPVTIADAQYSRERTAALVGLFQAEHNLKSILFNDLAIPGVKRWDGHDNHLHVSMKR